MRKEAFQTEPAKDQHMMTSRETVERLVSCAGVGRRDTVLEIGAGFGILTKALARKAGRVIAVEMDRRFAGKLGRLGAGNVEIIYANALDIIDKTGFNKIVSNIPYAICEPLLGKLSGRSFDLAVLSVPEGFYKIISSGPGEKNYSTLSLRAQCFFRTDFAFRIKKDDFDPPPRTESVAVVLKPLSMDAYRKSPEKFVFREIFLQKDKKLRNSLVEALISLNTKILGGRFTKNMARERSKKMGLHEKMLGKKAGDLKADDFEKLRKALRFS